METYFITAKTIELAYAEANAKYADGKHEVSCEVVEMPKKGFLGIGAKDAKIKVTVTTSASAELGSIVKDMKNMKSITDRGNNDKPQNGKSGKPADKQQNRENKNGDKRDNRNDRPQNQNKNNNNNQKKNNQNSNNQNKQENKKNENAAEQKPVNKPKSALHNQAKPTTRQQVKHIDSDVSGANVQISKTVGLTDFVANEKKNGFGSETRTGGSMNNDIRKKKPAKPMISTEKADEKMRASKYDMAETDDDYKSLADLEKENENRLEKEAKQALGFGKIATEIEVDTEEDASEEIPAPAVEVRKKEPITQAEMDYALAFANTLLENMNLEARAVACECPEDEEFETNGDANVYPKIEIIGDDTGILIGHHGETLDAIQYLVNLSALRKTKSKDGDYVKIVVDIENYREKRAQTLKSLARRMAAKAVKYKRNVFLEPMNAYERRIIHSELQNYPNVSTHSVGADRDRKIIITYEGADKVTDRNSENGENPNRSSSGGRNRRRRGRGGRKSEGSGEKVSAELIQQLNEGKGNRKVQKVPFEQLTDILNGADFLGGDKE